VSVSSHISQGLFFPLSYVFACTERHKHHNPCRLLRLVYDADLSVNNDNVSKDAVIADFESRGQVGTSHPPPDQDYSQFTNPAASSVTSLTTLRGNSKHSNAFLRVARPVGTSQLSTLQVNV
jgi:hypothetical protein